MGCLSQPSRGAFHPIKRTCVRAAAAYIVLAADQRKYVQGVQAVRPGPVQVLMLHSRQSLLQLPLLRPLLLQ